MSLLPQILAAFFPFFASGADIEPVQDLLVQGHIMQTSETDCEVRFAEIDNILSKYQRNFTMLTIGAKEGYYALRAAEMYKGSTFILQERGESAKKLLSILYKNAHLDNLVLLDTNLIMKNLNELIDSNHFDVALFLATDNYLIRAKPPAIIRFYNMLSNLATHVIVEVPSHLTSHHRILKKFSKCYKSVSLSNPDSTFYFLAPKEQKLKRPYPFASEHEVEIYATENDLLAVEKHKDSPHYLSYPIPTGINFVTFKLYGGIYPNTQMQREIIENALWYLHPNSLPWHLFLQGTKATLHDPPLIFQAPIDGEGMLNEFLKDPRSVRYGK